MNLILKYISGGAGDFRNFYFFGHGNSTAIGAFNNSGTTITADQIAFALGNVPLDYSGPPQFDSFNPDVPTMITPTYATEILHVALHPYRFVFVDGCETARGKFCESFAIPSLTVSTNFFASAGVESRAYLGYRNTISFNVNQWDWRSIMLGNFLTSWEGNTDLQTCVSAAQAETFQPMDSSAVIYGAYDLKISTRTRP